MGIGVLQKRTAPGENKLTERRTGSCTFLNCLRIPAHPTGLRAGKMGWPTGLEPATTRTTIWGSTIELRPPTMKRNKILRFESLFANPVSVWLSVWTVTFFSFRRGRKDKGGQAFNLCQTKDSTFPGDSTNSRRRWNENLPAA